MNTLNNIKKDFGASYVQLEKRKRKLFSLFKIKAVKYNLIRLLMPFVAVMGSYELQAQNATRYSLYSFNKIVINPAFAGGEEVAIFSGHYRNQWTGLKSAPKTFTFSAHAPFFEHKVGAGLSVVADKIGILNVYNTELSYAYRVKTGDEQTLSIGISGQIQYCRIARKKTNPLGQGDVEISEMSKDKLQSNLGFGIYYQTKKYYLGASIPRLFRTTAYDEYKGLRKLKSYYAMAGSEHGINANVSFQPSFLLSYIPNAPFEMDVSMNFTFYKRLMMGVSYRLQNSINSMIQYKVSEQVKIAAAIDIGISDLRQDTPGSFEVMMEYRMIKTSGSTPNIRYFF